MNIEHNDNNGAQFLMNLSFLFVFILLFQVFGFIIAPIVTAECVKCNKEEFDQVLSYIHTLESIEADFIQMTPSGGLLQRGKITLAKPKYVRLEYHTPNRILILIDGDKVLHYDYELKEKSFISDKGIIEKIVSNDIKRYITSCVIDARLKDSSYKVFKIKLDLIPSRHKISRLIAHHRTRKGEKVHHTDENSAKNDRLDSEGGIYLIIEKIKKNNLFNLKQIVMLEKDQISSTMELFNISNVKVDKNTFKFIDPDSGIEQLD